MKLRLLVLIVLAALLPSSVGSATVGDLRSFVRGSWQEVRKAHAGRPTVVHFWGLTCGPCRVEMPHWGELLSKRPDLNLVLINADFVPDDPRAVVSWLDKTRLLTAENWIFADSFVERLRHEIDPTWRGEIPLTKLISPDGKVSTVTGVMPLEDIITWLEKQKSQ